MEFKINIGDPKSKKTYKKALTDDDAKRLIGKKIGDKIKGESLDLTGYELLITGGSDNAGFPMRKSVNSSGRKKIFTAKAVGFRDIHKKKKGDKKLRVKHDGLKVRKTVVGNTISEQTAQINLKVTKQGKKTLNELLAPKEEKKVEETPTS